MKKISFFAVAFIFLIALFIQGCDKNSQTPFDSGMNLENDNDFLIDSSQENRISQELEVGVDYASEYSQEPVIVESFGVEDGLLERLSTQFPVDGTGWYHYPGSTYHYPSNGWGRADDTYALDLNLPNNNDNGKYVKAIANGVVKQKGSSGWILIEHTGTISWKGRTYSKWWSGYLHMSNISVNVGQSVTKGQQIGKVSNVGTGSAHLHFAVYVGSLTSASSSYPNSHLLSFNPSILAGSFSGFNYETASNPAIYDVWVDEIASSGSYVFEKGGSSSDWFDSWSYGFFGHLYWTNGKNGTDDNWANWRFNDGVPKTASDWRIYVFIPRNYATATAKYNIYRNGTLYTIKTINQNSYNDQWVPLSSLTFSQGQLLRIYTADGGSNSGKKVGYDIIRRWKKNDRQLTM